MHPYRKVRKLPRFQNRIDADWAGALDLYQIRWRYLPPPVNLGLGTEQLPYSFELYLPATNTYLDTKTSRSKREPLLRAHGFISWQHQVVLGSSDGRFEILPPFLDSPVFLLVYCPRCRKYSFSELGAQSCGHCEGGEVWNQELERLSWFGFGGHCQVQPRHLGKEEHVVTPSEKPIQPIAVGSTDLPGQLFSDHDAESARARESGEWEKLRYQLSGPPRVHQWPAKERLEDLAKRYPNFAEVCDYLLRELELSKFKPDKSIQFPSLLLVGSPSCGKSSFATQLAEILVKEDFTRIDMGQQATNFALVGSDSTFKKGKEGRILRAMAGRGSKRPVRNPMIILDEVDKVNQEGQWDPLPALLTLLEKRDAKRFVDEFFNAPVDASGLLCIALANDERAIPGALATRLVSFTIPDYTEEQFEDVVIPNIYQEWRRDFYESTFPENLSQSMRRRIASAADYLPRRVRPTLNQLVAQECEDLWPRPTWETIRQHTEKEMEF